MNSLPPAEQLLLTGGDQRLALDPSSGLNKYGCGPLPDPQLLAFGSSTASAISEQGFAAAERLRQKLLETINTESPAITYAFEMQRIRRQWLELCGLSDTAGIELVFSPSGTELHGIAAHYSASGASAPAMIIMVEANETGNGVASALSANSAEIVQVRLRLDDGLPRPMQEIDFEVENMAEQAVAAGRRVLLILVDQSKTGLIAPNPECAIALQRRYPDNVEVLVDACQFRIGIPTLRAYLEHGFMVALTGSKFLTGPSFSAALLLPADVAQRLQQRPFPNALQSCSSRAHWPVNWIGAEQLQHSANFGLLLRLEVAVEELKRFRAVPETTVVNFLLAFASIIHQRLQSDPHFEPLPVPLLDRRALMAANSWDHCQTIFPFLLYRPQTAGRLPLDREQTQDIYQQLPNVIGDADSAVAATRCQLGQPVACGSRHGIAVSALRLCVSSRLVIEAAAKGGNGDEIINQALTVLDKTVLLIQSRNNS